VFHRGTGPTRSRSGDPMGRSALEALIHVVLSTAEIASWLRWSPFLSTSTQVTTRDVRFRLAKQHESADAEADDSNADCRTDTTVNILTIADFGNG
jgi:hypothetical protein